MYFNELNVHTVGPSMTTSERLMTPLGVMTRSLGTTGLGGHASRLGNQWGNILNIHSRLIQYMNVTQLI